ncbi:HU family DNA-binding protein [Spiroplasma endosymbiont of Asaphidion curtum]
MYQVYNNKHLGKFMIVKKNARTVKNPKTGQISQMSEHYSPKCQNQ